MTKSLPIQSQVPDLLIPVRTQQARQPHKTILSLKSQWLDDLFLIDRAPATLDAHRGYLTKFCHDMGVGGRHPSRVPRSTIDEWVNPDSAITARTRHARLSVLRQFYRWCVEARHVQSDPTTGIRVRLRDLPLEQKEPRERPLFTDEMVERVLGVCRNKPDDPICRFWYIATVLGRYTGLRISDVCLLEKRSLTWRPGQLVIWMRKVQKRVILPLTPQVLADAVAMIQSTDERYCFPDYRERYLTNRTCIPHQFRSLLTEAGVSDVSFHGLRHAYAWNAIREGKRTPHVRIALGHSSDAMTERYIDEEVVL